MRVSLLPCVLFTCLIIHILGILSISRYMVHALNLDINRGSDHAIGILLNLLIILLYFYAVGTTGLSRILSMF